MHQDASVLSSFNRIWIAALPTRFRLGALTRAVLVIGGDAPTSDKSFRRNFRWRRGHALLCSGVDWLVCVTASKRDRKNRCCDEKKASGRWQRHGHLGSLEDSAANALVAAGPYL
jgi:hypothetical protein